MMITGNEVAVDNQMRRAEKQSQSPVDHLLQGASSTAEALSLATGSAIGGIAKAFGIARRFTSGLGVATLDENLDHLGNATEAALSRVERNLEAQGVRVDEIERRLNSNELFEGIKAATLQAQRTKDKKRLERMALILANGVAEDDLGPERLDDMMRAAVELKDDDILVLDKLCREQAEIVSTTGKTHGDLWPTDVQRNWQEHLFEHGIPGRSGQHYLDWRSSLVRLVAFGFLLPVQFNPTTNSPGHEPYGVSQQGFDFLQRLKAVD